MRAGLLGSTRCTRFFEDILPAAAFGRQGQGASAIVADLHLDGVVFGQPQRGQGRPVPRCHWFDFKAVHKGSAWYTATRRAQTQLGEAVARRARMVATDYVRHAREVDARYWPQLYLAAEVAAGRVAPGPVAQRLAQFPPTTGLAFGASGEASPEVDALRDLAVAKAAEDWCSLGVRNGAAAKGLLTAAFTQEWGVTAARAAVRLRLARVPVVGMTTDQARAHRARPRLPAARRQPRDVEHRANVLLADAVAGAFLQPPAAGEVF